MPKLKMFFKPTCPFCLKVIDYIEINEIKVDLSDINDNVNASDLVKIGGKRQVPCLLIDGKPLYESDDIIKWFKSHKY
ncbi:MAG: glutaredoxin [Omnitrophica WOR_2 bacterium GWF2_38_59]|nr:MAG: glutaredoxin [Omnitrophica WOR_2 bacterium GWF2_38_59]OGX51252.1 MAG: glutaredoxin [Omnitrophica WOR_2 bacterium RIFOXYA2_FULL_38_17]OGX54351.1 MAG: glutaredoxin [Omnitrophica WOR_2 bacterium RIFOXYA12_FULL_38_10]OGX57961.1 MAG: glutaredoxin [Omnitrophica WOR_2 bacterium RIFOXYC2_FULL_38_12]